MGEVTFPAPPPNGAGNDDWRTWKRALGRHARAVREFLHLSQVELAARGGVTQGTVSRLENGYGFATPMVIVVKILAVLGDELGKVGESVLAETMRQLFTILEPLGRPADSAPGPVAISGDPELDELVRLYRSLPTRGRAFVRSFLRHFEGSLE